MNNTTLIAANQVTQEFMAGEELIRPIDNVSFTVDENSFNIVYGPSGSGKSTLLNILTGLQKPTHGTVLVGGKDMYQLNRNELANFRARQLGFVYQTNYWIKSLNVLDNVAMSLYFSGYSRHKAMKLAMDALGMVSMTNYAKKFPTLLSGGEQQRVATARALATNPSFLIADEPTGSLDSQNGDMIMDLLRHCQRELGQTIILVTHDMEYLPLGDKLLHIEDGHVREMPRDSIRETTEALFDDMKARFERFTEVKK